MSHDFWKFMVHDFLKINVPRFFGIHSPRFFGIQCPTIFCDFGLFNSLAQAGGGGPYYMIKHYQKHTVLNYYILCGYFRISCRCWLRFLRQADGLPLRIFVWGILVRRCAGSEDFLGYSQCSHWRIGSCSSGIIPGWSYDLFSRRRL